MKEQLIRELVKTGKDADQMNKQYADKVAALEQVKMSHVMRKPVYAYANNKGADQPAHPRSLISAFVVCCLGSIISQVSIPKISRLQLASVAAQAGWCLT